MSEAFVGPIRRLLLILALGAVAACAHQPKTAVYTFTASPTTLTPESPAFATYPISAAFAKNGPSLTANQREWVMRVLRSGVFRRERGRLRFSLVPYGTLPLTVYATGNYDDQGHDRGGHIIGGACNSDFDPFEHGWMAATGADCDTFTPDPV